MKWEAGSYTLCFPNYLFSGPKVPRGVPKLEVHIYWVGQKFIRRFSIRCYGKTHLNFLANPIESTELVQ